MINDQPAEKNSFPILTQLGVLSLMMILIFSSWLHKKHTASPEEQTQVAGFPIDTNQYPIIPQAIDEIPLRAKAAYVFDVRGQRALYNKNADEALPLASITKLMTTLLTFELMSDDTQTSVPLSATLQEGSSGLSVNERFTAEQLRELALVSSSNDAAYTLGASVGNLLGDGDPTTQFVKAMNIRAEEMGLNSLKFWNTTGLDLSPTESGAIGSARDVSFLMEYIITHHPEIISDTQKASTRVYNTAGQYHDVNNTDEIVLDIPNLIGSKTGYTDLAGGNLTIAFDAGLNRPIIVTVLGSTREERFSDVMKLIKAVQTSFANQETP